MIDTTMLKNWVDGAPCSAGYKDTDSVFHYANADYAKIVGLKHAGDVMGRTAYDMPARTAECAELSHAQDKKVINSNKPLCLLGIHPDKQGNFKAYKFTKKPLCDEGQDVSGIFVVGEDITSRAMFEMGKFLQEMPIMTNGKLLLDSGSYLIGLEHADINISQREHEILFYFLRKRKAKIIASTLGITQRTIYKHMESLRSKFAVHTSSELRDKASEMGFVGIIPERLFVTVAGKY